MPRDGLIELIGPYPAYRASGSEWLGDVPAHWDVRPIKTLLRERSQKGYPNEPLLAATQTKGVVRKEQYESRTVLAMKDLHLLKLVEIGDFVISLRSFQGGIEYAKERGIISPAYTILYPVDTDVHAYLARVFKSKPYRENLTLHVTGIRQGQNINYTDLSRSHLPLPPPLEQRAIVRYLDHMDRRILRYIDAKRRVIALLEEEKQAVVSRAVTRGIDPNTCLKPSGIEWLGDIPKHWEVRRIRTIAEMRVSNVDKQIRDGEIPVRLCNYVDVYKNERITKTISFMRATASRDEIDRFRVEEDDVLITKDSETWDDIGVPALVAYSAEDLICGYHLALLRPGDKIIGAYLSRALQTKQISYQFHVVANGVTRYGLTHNDIQSVRLPLPPLDEQCSIVKYMDKAIAKIDVAVACARRQMELVQEYRTRLIADVVTGKLDVRKAAAQLPDEDDHQGFVEVGSPVTSDLN